MNTLRVSLRNDKDTRLLMSLLNTMNIVEDVQVEPRASFKDENQYMMLKKVLDQKAGRALFAKIGDPVKWQREIRDEWD